ncbi:MAG: thioesterase family protein [Acidimicrobiia bacterium]
MSRRIPNHDDPQTVTDMIHTAMQRVPFGQWLGLELTHLTTERVHVGLKMRDEFVGNPARNILHGGIISAVLDTVGGFAALLGVVAQGRNSNGSDEVSPWLSTIDLRTDFLRPGTGDAFTAEAYPLRVGNRLAVTRMELHNDAETLIAVGTGTYIIP